MRRLALLTLAVLAAACDGEPTSSLQPATQVYSMADGGKLEVQHDGRAMQIRQFRDGELLIEALFTDASTGRATFHLDGKKVKFKVVNGNVEEDRGGFRAYIGSEQEAWAALYDSYDMPCCAEKKREVSFAAMEYLALLGVMYAACSPADAFIGCGAAIMAAMTAWGRLVYAMDEHKRCRDAGCKTAYIRAIPSPAAHLRRYGWVSWG